MPYIKQEARRYAEIGPTTAGELNFALTMLIKGYWEDGKNYQAINDILGALEGCKAEFYRRVVVEYEQQKMKENGDVYDN
jgi:hypothetical protein